MDCIDARSEISAHRSPFSYRILCSLMVSACALVCLRTYAANSNVPLPPDTATVGMPYSNQLPGSGSYDFAGSGFPNGVTVELNSGLISGTPTEEGTFNITVIATTNDQDDLPPDGDGDEDEIIYTYVLTVSGAGPVITSASAASGCVNEEFFYEITATVPAGSHIDHFELRSSSVFVVGPPPGCDFDSASGTIAGVPIQSGVYTFQIVAVDDSNPPREGSAPLTITIGDRPIITSVLSAHGTSGTPFSYPITVDSANPAKTYDAIGLPPGLSVSTSTGLISGTPTTDCSATDFLVTIIAFNDCGEDDQTLELVIDSTNPIVASTSLVTCVGLPFTYQISATTPNGAINQYDAEPLPPGLDINGATGLISGIPTNPGTYKIKLGAHDATCDGEGFLNLTVNNPPAQLDSPGDQSAIVNVPFSVTVPRLDGNSPVTFIANGLPAGLSIDSTGTISGAPFPSALSINGGHYEVSVTATNSCGNSNTVLFEIVVSIGVGGGTDTNCPVITSSPTPPNGLVGSPYSYQIVATNAPTRYSSTTLPAGLTLNTATGLISGTPTVASGTVVTVTAYNATCLNGGSLDVHFVVQGPVATVPVITSAKAVAGGLGAAFSYQITATNTPTSYGATSLPPGLTLNTGTGLISGTPLLCGVFQTIISATNAVGSGFQVVTITISGSGKPVITSMLSLSLPVNNTMTPYFITATNCPTSFGAANLPTGLKVDPTTGAISGTPTATGVYDVIISATNSQGTGANVLAIKVFDASLLGSSPPKVLDANASGIVGQPFAFKITATVAAGSTPVTSYGLQGTIPSGLLFNPTTGVISGTPTQSGLFPNVIITATNSVGTGQGTLTITINTAAPVINSALTAAGTTGSAFRYQITATNSPTRFGATPLPSGLTFNTATGVISGTPLVAGVTNITLTAYNGTGRTPREPQSSN